LKEWQVSTGIEYKYQEILALRGGYFYENRGKGGRQYFTLGLGFNYQWLGANFSYLVPSGGGVDNNPIRQSLRASLLFHLVK
jgi:long-subunit fatty acid transport protein